MGPAKKAKAEKLSVQVIFDEFLNKEQLMEILENIKKILDSGFFQRDLKFNKRIKSVSNIDDAKSIGIL